MCPHYRVDAAVPPAAAAGDGPESLWTCLQHLWWEAFQVVAVLHQEEVHGQISPCTQCIMSSPAPQPHLLALLGYLATDWCLLKVILIFIVNHSTVGRSRWEISHKSSCHYMYERVLLLWVLSLWCCTITGNVSGAVPIPASVTRGEGTESLSRM